MKYKRSALCTLLCIALSSSYVHSQHELTRIQSPQHVFAVRAEQSGKNTSPYFLVRMRNNLKRNITVSDKIKVVRYLANGHAIIMCNDTVMLRNAMFESVLHANDLWKLSDKLLQVDLDEVGIFTIRLGDGKSSLVQNILLKHGVNANVIADNVLEIRCSQRVIHDHILPLEDVLYVGEEKHEATVESRILDLNLEPNTICRLHHEFPALDGDGITISIKENLYDPDDIDIDGRHVPSSFAATEIDNHTTDMATIAAGAGNLFVTGRGVAKAASITSSNFLGDIFPDEDADYQSVNAWVQNHSYGTIIENFYGPLAEAYDLSANRNPQLLHVFSSGNKGTETSAEGRYQGISGMANLTGNFKMSKNSMVIGSVDTVGREIAFASRGPAYDGRVKPELVTYSTAGTSNSAALISGLVSILQQAYMQANGVLPSSSLLKAILINSAQDVGLPGLDFVTGYGNADGYRAVQNLLGENYSIGSINHGETDNIVLNIPPNAVNLKITMVWNDPAAAVNSDQALVNDLDVKVTDPATTDWLPWVLDDSPVLNKLVMASTRQVDHLNNVEQVTIASPTAGNYTVTVSGFDIPDGPQEYVIAYQWDIAEQFEWSFPSGSDNMPYNGESGSYFRWKSTLSAGTGTLEYSVDGGNNWSVIKNNVDLAKGYYRWLAPDLNTRAIARMVVGSANYTTDNFTISRPLELQVGFNCADSLMLQWDKVPNAVDYEVLTFNERYVEQLLVTTDTSLILDKEQSPSRYYAVRPRLQGVLPAIVSQLYDYEQQGVKCFFQNFFSLEEGAAGIRLTLQLGTTYGIEEIFFERKSGELFEVLASSGPTNNNMEYLDAQPEEGYNYYRARITLINGEEVTTDVVENFFLSDAPYAIFPNPVSQSAGLTINSRFNQSTGGVFRLHKSDGGLVLAYELSSDREVVNLNHIPQGLYFYTIQNGATFVSGRLVVMDH